MTTAASHSSQAIQRRIRVAHSDKDTQKFLLNIDKCREKEIFFGIYYAFFANHILLFKQITYLCIILMDIQFENQK